MSDHVATTHPPTAPTASTGADPSTHGAIARRVLDGLSRVGQPAVSPDGTRVAFVVSTIDVEDNTTRHRVWIDDAPVTAGDRDGNPTWSPCGRFLAFTSARGEKKSETTLHVMAVDGPGETRTVATRADGLSSPTWSPDGRHLAFTSRTPDARYDADSDADRSPRKVEHFMNHLNGEGWTFDRPSHVHLVAADGTGPVRALTTGVEQHGSVAWLPDSSAVVTTVDRVDRWRDGTPTDLLLVPIDGSDPITLTAGDGVYGQPAVSPDGTRVAFIGSADPLLYPQNDAVGVIALDPAGGPVPSSAITWASAGLDRPFTCTQGGSAPIWLDDNTMVAIAEDRGTQHLYRIAADGATAPEALTTGPITVADVAAAAGTIATVRSTVTCPAELYMGEERRTRVAAAAEARALGWEHFTVPTSDGTGEIDAWIMRPAAPTNDTVGTNGTGSTNDTAGATKVPVLLNVHGGPFTQYGEYFFDEFQMQAAAGFVVVAGNPRGSSGRDTAWGQAIIGPKHPTAPGHGWGTVDVDDVMAIIDTALERYPICDPERVAMLGGSYGGYMATTLATRHSDRFRGFCSERAVNNLISMEWSSDIATAFNAIHGVNHIEDPEEYRLRSPITRVAEIDAPMLIIHSEEDWRCPINQAEELWVALKLLDKPVDFYRFPGESHELTRSGSPLHRIQRAEIILDWFDDKMTD